MKTISLQHSPISPVSVRIQGKPGFVKQVFPRLRMMAQSLRDQAGSFAAVGLAEGGDVEGAAELLERSSNGRS
ncbi:MAG TPA: hypothetical protein VEP67_07270 [Thiobacillaceae bacterium]|nr:hypothetical protein [Thiobacillaceae bacterium]